MFLTRRELLASCAALAPSLAAAHRLPEPERQRLGIAEYSFGQRLAADRAAGGGITDPIAMLDYCHDLGAGGVQLAIGSRDQEYTTRLRARAEKHGMFVEGSLRTPRDRADVERFTREVAAAREAGARVLRTVLTSGRRYEAYPSAEAFKQATERAYQMLTLAEPIVARADMRLAVENHKDWRAPEFANLLKRIDSRHVGICVDTGNSIALLEDPLEVIEAYAPWAFSVHIKDMAVAEYEDGFLLSEVPLGEGFLDLSKIVTTLRRSRPEVHFNLEMITRDPLKVPCLTPRYWATMESLPARELARMLALVRKHKQNLPQVSQLARTEQIGLEEKNVRKCLAYFGQNLQT